MSSFPPTYKMNGFTSYRFIKPRIPSNNPLYHCTKSCLLTSKEETYEGGTKKTVSVDDDGVQSTITSWEEEGVSFTLDEFKHYTQLEVSTWIEGEAGMKYTTSSHTNATESNPVPNPYITTYTAIDKKKTEETAEIWAVVTKEFSPSIYYSGSNIPEGKEKGECKFSDPEDINDEYVTKFSIQFFRDFDNGLRTYIRDYEEDTATYAYDEYTVECKPSTITDDTNAVVTYTFSGYKVVVEYSQKECFPSSIDPSVSDIDPVAGCTGDEETTYTVKSTKKYIGNDTKEGEYPISEQIIAKVTCTCNGGKKTEDGKDYTAKTHYTKIEKKQLAIDSSCPANLCPSVDRAFYTLCDNGDLYVTTPDGLIYYKDADDDDSTTNLKLVYPNTIEYTVKDGDKKKKIKAVNTSASTHILPWRPTTGKDCPVLVGSEVNSNSNTGLLCANNTETQKNLKVPNSCLNLPYGNGFYCVQVDYDRCVVFYKGTLVYDGLYDGMGAPLSFAYGVAYAGAGNRNCTVSTHLDWSYKLLPKWKTNAFGNVQALTTEQWLGSQMGLGRNGKITNSNIVRTTYDRKDFKDGDCEEGEISVAKDGYYVKILNYADGLATGIYENNKVNVPEGYPEKTKEITISVTFEYTIEKVKQKSETKKIKILASPYAVGAVYPIKSDGVKYWTLVYCRTINKGGKLTKDLGDFPTKEDFEAAVQSYENGGWRTDKKIGDACTDFGASTVYAGLLPIRQGCIVSDTKITGTKITEYRVFMGTDRKRYANLEYKFEKKAFVDYDCDYETVYRCEEKETKTETLIEGQVTRCNTKRKYWYSGAKYNECNMINSYSVQVSRWMVEDCVQCEASGNDENSSFSLPTDCGTYAGYKTGSCLCGTNVENCGYCRYPITVEPEPVWYHYVTTIPLKGEDGTYTYGTEVDTADEVTVIPEDHSCLTKIIKTDVPEESEGKVLTKSGQKIVKACKAELATVELDYVGGIVHPVMQGTTATDWAYINRSNGGCRTRKDYTVIGPVSNQDASSRSKELISTLTIGTTSSSSFEIQLKPSSDSAIKLPESGAIVLRTPADYTEDETNLRYEDEFIKGPSVQTTSEKTTKYYEFKDDGEKGDEIKKIKKEESTKGNVYTSSTKYIKEETTTINKTEFGKVTVADKTSQATKTTTSKSETETKYKRELTMQRTDDFYIKESETSKWASLFKSKANLLKDVPEDFSGTKSFDVESLKKGIDQTFQKKDGDKNVTYIYKAKICDSCDDGYFSGVESTFKQYQDAFKESTVTSGAVKYLFFSVTKRGEDDWKTFSGSEGGAKVTGGIKDTTTTNYYFVVYKDTNEQYRIKLITEKDILYSYEKTKTQKDQVEYSKGASSSNFKQSNEEDAREAQAYFMRFFPAFITRPGYEFPLNDGCENGDFDWGTTTEIKQFKHNCSFSGKSCLTDNENLYIDENQYDIYNNAFPTPPSENLTDAAGNHWRFLSIESEDGEEWYVRWRMTVDNPNEKALEPYVDYKNDFGEFVESRIPLPKPREECTGKYVDVPFSTNIPVKVAGVWYCRGVALKYEDVYDMYNGHFSTTKKDNDNNNEGDDDNKETNEITPKYFFGTLEENTTSEFTQEAGIWWIMPVSSYGGTGPVIRCGAQLGDILYKDPQVNETSGEGDLYPSNADKYWMWNGYEWEEGSGNFSDISNDEESEKVVFYKAEGKLDIGDPSQGNIDKSCKYEKSTEGDKNSNCSEDTVKSCTQQSKAIFVGKCSLQSCGNLLAINLNSDRLGLHKKDKLRDRHEAIFYKGEYVWDRPAYEPAYNADGAITATNDVMVESFRCLGDNWMLLLINTGNGKQTLHVWYFDPKNKNDEPVHSTYTFNYDEAPDINDIQVSGLDEKSTKRRLKFGLLWDYPFLFVKSRYKYNKGDEDVYKNYDQTELQTKTKLYIFYRGKRINTYSYTSFNYTDKNHNVMNCYRRNKSRLYCVYAPVIKSCFDDEKIEGNMFVGGSVRFGDAYTGKGRCDLYKAAGNTYTVKTNLLCSINVDGYIVEIPLWSRWFLSYIPEGGTEPVFESYDPICYKTIEDITQSYNKILRIYEQTGTRENIKEDKLLKEVKVEHGIYHYSGTFVHSMCLVEGYDFYLLNTGSSAVASIGGNSPFRDTSTNIYGCEALITSLDRSFEYSEIESTFGVVEHKTATIRKTKTSYTHEEPECVNCLENSNCLALSSGDCCFPYFMQFQMLYCYVFIHFTSKNLPDYALVHTGIADAANHHHGLEYYRKSIPCGQPYLAGVHGTSCYGYRGYPICYSAYSLPPSKQDIKIGNQKENYSVYPIDNIVVYVAGGTSAYFYTSYDENDGKDVKAFYFGATIQFIGSPDTEINGCCSQNKRVYLRVLGGDGIFGLINLYMDGDRVKINGKDTKACQYEDESHYYTEYQNERDEYHICRDNNKVKNCLQYYSYVDFSYASPGDKCIRATQDGEILEVTCANPCDVNMVNRCGHYRIMLLKNNGYYLTYKGSKITLFKHRDSTDKTALSIACSMTLACCNSGEYAIVTATEETSVSTFGSNNNAFYCFLLYQGSVLYQSREVYSSDRPSCNLSFNTCCESGLGVVVLNRKVSESSLKSVWVEGRPIDLTTGSVVSCPTTQPTGSTEGGYSDQVIEDTPQPTSGGCSLAKNQFRPLSETGFLCSGWDSSVCETTENIRVTCCGGSYYLVQNNTFTVDKPTYLDLYAYKDSALRKNAIIVWETDEKKHKNIARIKKNGDKYDIGEYAIKGVTNLELIEITTVSVSYTETESIPGSSATKKVMWTDVYEVPYKWKATIDGHSVEFLHDLEYKAENDCTGSYVNSQDHIVAEKVRYVPWVVKKSAMNRFAYVYWHTSLITKDPRIEKIQCYRFNYHPDTGNYEGVGAYAVFYDDPFMNDQDIYNWNCSETKGGEDGLSNKTTKEVHRWIKEQNAVRNVMGVKGTSPSRVRRERVLYDASTIDMGDYTGEKCFCHSENGEDESEVECYCADKGRMTSMHKNVCLVVFNKASISNPLRKDYWKTDEPPIPYWGTKRDVDCFDRSRSYWKYTEEDFDEFRNDVVYINDFNCAGRWDRVSGDDPVDRWQNDISSPDIDDYVGYGGDWLSAPTHNYEQSLVNDFYDPSRRLVASGNNLVFVWGETITVGSSGDTKYHVTGEDHYTACYNVLTGEKITIPKDGQ